VRLCRRSPTNRLPDPNKQHTLRHHAIRVIQMQHAQSGVQTVEAETGPGSQVVAQALVVHYFESVGVGCVSWGSYESKGDARR
jgi:hypothetical protein